MSDYDLVIRGGSVLDGTGADARIADVAVTNGRIAAIGRVEGRGIEEIDAHGCIVTPGFVDVHTHYDGQAIWSQRIAPSSAHGVTTVVVGNCGVGFAPCRPDDHDLLVSAMEGVEDIPEIVMTTGLTWDWETFPEYLDALEARPRDIDVAAYLPHSALRVYVMGERGANREPATAEDRERMAAITREAVAAGAIGFATSSHPIHRRIDGEFIPSFKADEEELQTIASAVGESGRGVFQMVAAAAASPDRDEARATIDMLGRISRKAGIPATFTMVQPNDDSGGWRTTLDWIDANGETGASIRPQIFPRPIGMIIGHELSINPFGLCPTYRALERLPLAKRIVELRRPEVRAKLISEEPLDPTLPILKLSRDFSQMFPISDPPNYEPAPDTSIAAEAARRGMAPEELAYDLLLEQDGKAMLYIAASNYADGNLDYVIELMKHPSVVIGLGDGGAHYGIICDSSFPTYVLTHLTRDRNGERVSLPHAIRALTMTPARMVGMNDRGVLAPGLKADLNVIDYAGLKLDVPRVAYDLPAGGRRLDQSAKGYRCTIVGGKVIARDGQATGALPGRLVRMGRELAPEPLAAE